MSVGLVILIILMLLWASGNGLAFSAMIAAALAGAVFIGFWWVLAKIVLGFGRWVTAPADFPPRRFGSQSRTTRGSTGPSKVCADRLCGRANPAGARFCAQCGKRLGSSKF